MIVVSNASPLIVLGGVGLIAEVEPHLMAALEAGLRLDNDTVTTILELAGELAGRG